MDHMIMMNNKRYNEWINQLEARVGSVQQELAENKATGNSDEIKKKLVELLERAERVDTIIIKGIDYDVVKHPNENIITEMYKKMDYQLYWDEIKFVSRFTSDDEGIPTACEGKFHSPDNKNAILK